MLWGLGGVAAQLLLDEHRVDPGWLTGVRMAGAGLLLLAAGRHRWPCRGRRLLAAVAVVGMAATQLTWFAAISRSNVATATFIQYSGVAMTAAWQLARRSIRLTPGRLAALAAAAGGVTLLVLGGPGGARALRLSLPAVLLALASATAFCYYMLGSARLARMIGAAPAAAWGLAIGSIPVLAWRPPWQAHPAGSLLVVAGLVAWLALASTALAFWLSLASLRRITATEFAITSTLEPALAGLAGAVVLGVTLAPLQYLGAALTLTAIPVTATSGHRKPPSAPG